MSERYSCPNCGGQFKIPPSQRGHSMICPKCSATITVGESEVATEPAGSRSPATGSDNLSPLTWEDEDQGSLEAMTLDRAQAPPAGLGSSTADGPSDARSRGGDDPVEVAAPPSRSTSRPTGDERPNRGGQEPQVAAKVADDERFSLACKTCDTRVDVRRGQIGRTIRCPDCYQPILVTAPVVRPAKPKQKVVEDDDEIAISEPDERTAFNEAQRRHLQSRAERELERAERELDEDKERYTQLDDVDWKTWRPNLRPLLFLTQSSIWPRWILASVALSVPLMLFHWMTVISEPRLAAIIMAAGAVCLTIWLSAFSPKLLFIFEETARGRDQIDEWPTTTMFDNVQELIIIVGSIILSSVPIALVVYVVSLAGYPYGMLSFPALAGLIAAHPIVFLSMNEHGSVFMPFSPKVWQTTHLAGPAWGQYALWGLAELLVAWVGVLLLLYAGCLGAMMSALTLVLALLIHFRSLGYLAHACGRALKEST